MSQRPNCPHGTGSRSGSSAMRSAPRRSPATGPRRRSGFGSQSSVERFDEDVTLAGFGQFKMKVLPAHKGCDPATGETVDIAAPRKLTFTPAKPIEDALKVWLAAETRAHHASPLPYPSFWPRSRACRRSASGAATARTACW